MEGGGVALMFQVLVIWGLGGRGVEGKGGEDGRGGIPLHI